ncbi:hypothetical protein [Streptomyces sp. NBC_00576]|uniref:hypothetical protein n=1 Tax=Streptomyces sp. NBC_00576 TaxID=2903665 RepID=UPI002E80424A|nr:hypothetical protein [Streptomyces sp. NBC_00576]WUB72680.1 hypothetical protein OG734_22615 [Streptomyces sp. NBC_00576]
MIHRGLDAPATMPSKGGWPESFVASPADDFMVIEEKYGDFSAFRHPDGLTYRLFP